MYVDPFWFGVMCTIGYELFFIFIILVYTIIRSRHTDDTNKKED